MRLQGSLVGGPRIEVGGPNLFKRRANIMASPAAFKSGRYCCEL